MITQKTRSPALDLVRCYALFGVVGVHFFLNTGFYEQTVTGPTMFLLVLFRTLFMTCVPLFMTLSGYLLKNKQLTCAYYLRFIRILSVYAIASLTCALYRALFLPDTFSFRKLIGGLFGFYAAPYAWYIGMYLGLLLLIPFLNILYNNLTKKQKQVLILSLLTLSALHTVTNVRFYLVSSWWGELYPISYYFIGCYLSEYPWKIKTITNLFLSFIAFLLAGVLSFCLSLNQPFVEGGWQGWSSLITTIRTALIVNLFTQLDYRYFRKNLSVLFAHLSDWCMGAYLVSWIFDQVFYQLLNNAVHVYAEKTVYFLLIVPLVFVCSLFLSALIHLFHTSCVERIVQKLIVKCRTYFLKRSTPGRLL